MEERHPFPNSAVITLAQRHLSPSSVVLDVGCNQGQTSQAIKQKTGCRVIGIDNSRQAIEQARVVLDEAILANVESENLNLEKKLFDLIILSNILEHLKEPLAVLKALKKYLKPEGCFLIAVPNVAFWSVRLDLLLGKFDYQEAGILDPDHLRFFTASTLRELVEKAELKIQETTTNYLGWREKIARLRPALLASQLVILCSQPPKSPR